MEVLYYVPLIVVLLFIGSGLWAWRCEALHFQNTVVAQLAHIREPELGEYIIKLPWDSIMGHMSTGNLNAPYLVTEGFAPGSTISWVDTDIEHGQFIVCATHPSWKGKRGEIKYDGRPVSIPAYTDYLNEGLRAGIFAQDVVDALIHGVQVEKPAVVELEDPATMNERGWQA